MTQYERMQAGLIYDTTDPEIMKMQRPYKEKIWAYNQLTPAQDAEKVAYLHENFAECGEKCFIEVPFYAPWGGKNVHFGSGIYAGTNLTLVDDGQIYVGDRVLFGPNVTVAAVGHPLHALLRRQEMAFVRDVHIGENVWIGAGAIILPGVTIGKNSVIGAGAVVTRDVPESVVVAGNPARIIREIGALDDEFYTRSDRIDWDEIERLNMLHKGGIFRPKDE